MATFYLDEKVRLSKEGRHLFVYKKRTVGEPCILKDFFGSKETGARVHVHGYEVQQLEKGRPKEEVLVLKGAEEPAGIRFRLVIDPEEGRVLRKTVKR